VVFELNSQSKGCGFESRLIHTRWKWGQSHARSNSCSQFFVTVEKKEKNTGGQMGTPKKNIWTFILTHPSPILELNLDNNKTTSKDLH